MSSFLQTKGDSPSPCPGDSLLRLVCLGEAPEDVAEGVLAHVEKCPVCPIRMDAIWLDSTDPPDGFLISAREGSRPQAVLPLPPPSTPTRGLNRLKALAEKDLFDLAFLPPSPNRNCLGRLGHYDLMGVLGSGGMGIVFRAWDFVGSQTVAVKTLLGGRANSRRQIERFLEEASVTGQIKHPRVPPVLNHGMDRGIPYFVMPLLTGCNLHQLIHEKAPVDVDFAVNLMRQTLEALQAAHMAGVLHRDIKPSNLWLKRDPIAGESLFLLDFGLATRDERDERLTATGAILGTPAYLSPEQGLGGKFELTAASDLFSLGCVFYELLSGKRVFPGVNPLEIASAMVRHQILPLKKVNPKVPLPLSDLLMRMLSKSPAKRPQSAAEVLRALSAKDLYKDPLITRRQALSAGAASVAALATVGIWGWIRSNRNKVKVLRADSSLVFGADISFDFNREPPLNEGPRLLYGTDRQGHLWELSSDSGDVRNLCRFDLEPVALCAGIQSVVAANRRGDIQFYQTGDMAKLYPVLRNDDPAPVPLDNTKPQLLWTGNFGRFIVSAGNYLRQVQIRADQPEQIGYPQRTGKPACISSLFVNEQADDRLRRFTATVNHGWVCAFGAPSVQAYDRPVFGIDCDLRMCTKPNGLAIWTYNGELIVKKRMTDTEYILKTVLPFRSDISPESMLYGPEGETLALLGVGRGTGEILLVREKTGTIVARLDVENPVCMRLRGKDLWVLANDGRAHCFRRFEEVSNRLF